MILLLIETVCGQRTIWKNKEMKKKQDLLFIAVNLVQKNIFKAVYVDSHAHTPTLPDAVLLILSLMLLNKLLRSG